MRKRLKKLNGDSIRVCAVVSDKSTYYNGKLDVRTLLLRDIHRIDGKFLTDHVWVDVVECIENANVGDTVIFDARVTRYAKSSGTKTFSLDVEDSAAILNNPPTLDEVKRNKELKLLRSVRFTQYATTKTYKQKIHLLSQMANSVCRVEGTLRKNKSEIIIKDLMLTGDNKVLSNEMFCESTSNLTRISNGSRIRALATVNIPDVGDRDSVTYAIDNSTLNVLHLEHAM